MSIKIQSFYRRTITWHNQNGNLISLFKKVKKQNMFKTYHVYSYCIQITYFYTVAI